MVLSYFVGIGQHHEKVYSYFSKRALGAFYQEDLLSALYGQGWQSLLIADGNFAFLHCVVPSPIGETGFLDIIPWLGYAGPVLSANNAPYSFRKSAFALYSSYCQSQKIIAEIFRFDPWERNDLLWREITGLTILKGRQIAYAPIVAGANDAQIAQYTSPCKRIIKKWGNQFSIKQLEISGENVSSFVKLYHRSLLRVNARKRWFFSEKSLSKLCMSSAVHLWGAFDLSTGDLVSSILSVSDRRMAYSLLVANDNLKKYKGAHDILTHEVIKAFGRYGYDYLCLGGGGLNKSEDPLLRFKAKFCAGNLRSLPVGFFAHDVATYDALKEVATQNKDTPAITGDEIMETYLPYRLLPSLALDGLKPPRS